MNHKISCNWIEEMQFEGLVNNHKIFIDADETVGGKDNGPRPKPLILLALAGCTGMDVVSLLKKMRMEFSYFNMEVEGELSEEHPKYYQKIHLTYFFGGNILDMEKIEKAINLSKEKYCGVHAMLSRVAIVTTEIKIV